MKNGKKYSEIFSQSIAPLLGQESSPTTLNRHKCKPWGDYKKVNPPCGQNLTNQRQQCWVAMAIRTSPARMKVGHVPAPPGHIASTSPSVYRAIPTSMGPADGAMLSKPPLNSVPCLRKSFSRGATPRTVTACTRGPSSASTPIPALLSSSPPLGPPLSPTPPHPLGVCFAYCSR